MSDFTESYLKSLLSFIHHTNYCSCKIFCVLSQDTFAGQIMALAAQSMFLPHLEGNANICIRLGLTGDIRLQKLRGVGCRSVVVLNVLSSSCKSRHLQMLRPYPRFCSFGSRHSKLPRLQKEDFSTSAHSTRSNTPQVIPEPCYLEFWIKKSTLLYSSSLSFSLS